MRLVSTWRERLAFALRTRRVEGRAFVEDLVAWVIDDRLEVATGEGLGGGIGALHDALRIEQRDRIAHRVESLAPLGKSRLQALLGLVLGRHVDDQALQRLDLAGGVANRDATLPDPLRLGAGGDDRVGDRPGDVGVYGRLDVAPHRLAILGAMTSP